MVEWWNSVSDSYKSQKMCKKQLLFTYGNSECYNTQEKSDKAVNTYSSTIKFVPECFITQEMYDKAVNRLFFEFDYNPDQYHIYQYILYSWF